MFSSVIVAALSGALVAQAAPSLLSRQSITGLGTSAIDAFTPYTHFASAGYCAASATADWSCGANCDANPGFVVQASGGDGDAVQYWFVGYDPSTSEVIVSYQGTDPSEIEPLVTDGDFFLTALSSTLFPGVDSSLEIHNGFGKAQADTATDVLAAVKSSMSSHGATAVTVVGHSLGAAIALLTSVYLPLWLPSGTTYKTIGYGLPRVGNQAFADYVDANVKLTHINNMEDPIPICPGEFLGFVHPAGEVHIQDSGEWASCPGQDNSSDQCIVGDVPNITDGSLSNHDGPYNGVTMGC
ncbi:alpha/beta-hydrolase [Athelia psychrophila]|uniref:Alpha/beta-hydrolase n=1 Tax=Athelia psychrophila TaxID=1759441 RepID=A0A165XA06_9AGAM|nr:alpha/beta-hydrolase [Fibularhizoctonia sp. CBS 109695]